MNAEIANGLALVAVTGSLPIGGSSTFLLNFARAMRRRGSMLPVVVIDTENTYAGEFAAIGNPVHCLPRTPAIYEDRLAWAYAQTARYRPRAVLSCLSTASFEILRLLPPGVIRMGVVQSDDPGPYSALRMYAPWLDMTVGVSRQIAGNFQRYPELRNIRSAAIPYGIDFGPRPDRLERVPSDPLRLIYLGRLAEEQKRVSRLARLARILEAHNANVTMTIVGEGPQSGQLREDLRGCRIVAFHDAVPYDRVGAIFLESDVFVLLSDFEGLPLSLLEAMGSGVVPVVSDLASGISDVVQESRGFRIPVGDVERAASVIMELTADRRKLHEYSGAAAEFVRRHHSADAMSDQYCALVEGMAGNAGEWPPTTKVPVPKAVRPAWLFAPSLRPIRRCAKRFLGLLRRRHSLAS
jgi:glycosyltransferase involved in cell wall biosynthesis